MIFPKINPRLDYVTCKAVETPKHLILDGYLYDKMTLAKVSDERINVGWNKNPTDDKRISLITRFHNMLLPSDQAYGLQFYTTDGFFDTNGISKATAMWIDSTYPTIEWVWCGDSILKIDMITKKVQRFDATLNNTLFVFRSIALVQDDDYLYAFASSDFSNLQREPIIYSFHKKTAVLKKSLEIGNGYGIDSIQIVRHDHINRLVYVHALGYNFTREIVLSYVNGEVTQVWQQDNIDGMASIPSMMQFTNVNQNNTAIIYDSQGSQMLEQWLRLYKFDESKVTKVDEVNLHTDNTRVKNVLEFIKSKYKDNATVQNYTELEVRQNFIRISTTLNAERLKFWNIGNYLVMAIWPSISYLNRDYDSTWRWIAVWKQNKPDTDPLDITLTDYCWYKELNDAAPSIVLGQLDKVDDNTFIQQLGDTGIRFYTVSDEGKLQWKDAYIGQDWHDMGYDQFKRIYFSNINDNSIQIYNKKLPVELIVQYEDRVNDPYIEMPTGGAPIIKKILLKSINLYRDPVPAMYELTLEGNAVFVSSGEKIVQGQTDSNGEGFEEIKFQGAGTTVTIAKKLIYNNELAY